MAKHGCRFPYPLLVDIFDVACCLVGWKNNRQDNEFPDNPPHVPRRLVQHHTSVRQHEYSTDEPSLLLASLGKEAIGVELTTPSGCDSVKDLAIFCDFPIGVF